MIFALLFAPLMASPVLTGLTVLYRLQREPLRQALDGMSEPLFFFSVVGLPLAYLTEILLVAAFVACGGSVATVRRRWILVIGTTSGALVSAALFGDASWAALRWTAPAGALMGAAASATFALIRGPSDDLSWAS